MLLRSRRGLYDCILVEMTGGDDRFHRAAGSVEGTFAIQEFQRPRWQALAIYHIEGKEVN